jgi:hypothetical protein
VEGVNSRAQDGMSEIVNQGFSPIDIVTTFFRVAKSNDKFGEPIQLDFIKVEIVVVVWSALSLSDECFVSGDWDDADGGAERGRLAAAALGHGGASCACGCRVQGQHEKINTALSLCSTRS